LRVKKTPQGWLIYSVGPNLRDDGGKVEYPADGDVGIGPSPAAKPDEPAKNPRPSSATRANAMTEDISADK
jgi:hypothetical protein